MVNSFNNQVTQIILDCQNLKIPYFFSCTRKELGTALYGRKNIEGANASALAIIDPSGLENVNLKAFQKNTKFSRREQEHLLRDSSRTSQK
jgi:hypothetical protein